jgi:hypothetical protein
MYLLGRDLVAISAVDIYDVPLMGRTMKAQRVKKFNVQVMLRVVDGQREVRVTKLLDLDVFITVPHVEGDTN